MKWILGLGMLAFAPLALAGAQVYEPLADSVRTRLSRLVSDRAPAALHFRSSGDAQRWLAEMDSRLARRIPDRKQRLELLRTVHYEAVRARLDPQLVLGVMEVESAFRKYAISSAGARGYMQVMPFWASLIGDADSRKLFDLRANLRYGCTILRHYLDLENGNLFRALGRYNGSLGKADYPNLVVRTWHREWHYAASPTAGKRVVDVQVTRH